MEVHLMRWPFSLAVAFLTASSGFSNTIWVPDDYVAIQEAINAAVNGDEVVVRPGVYVGSINFIGKAITVRSEQGAVVTTIDGNQSGSVVTFTSGEGLSSTIDGFTITGGNADYGGGIVCNQSSSPTIINNRICDNFTVLEGGGIYCYESSPMIAGNVIAENRMENISCIGGGISCRYSSAVLVNNVIARNRLIGTVTSLGCGIYCHVSDLVITGNTITGNDSGGIVYAGGILCSSSTQTTITNCIVWDNAGPKEIIGQAVITHCNIRGGYSGTGNIDADPLFIDPVNGDYRLQQNPCQPGVTNPCVNAGDPNSSMATGTTRTDLLQDTGIVDMGYHYDIDSIPGIPYCYGDPGSGTPCPCTNDNSSGVPGSGCANGFFPEGARLTGSGTASITGDTLVLTALRQEPTESGLFLQAENDLSPGLLWGDGLRCAGGNLIRLQVRFADGGGASSTTIGISAKAGNINPGDTKYYQCWYRNPFNSPCGSGFNASNGYAIAWLP